MVTCEALKCGFTETSKGKIIASKPSNCSKEKFIKMANLTSYPSDAPNNEAWSLNNALHLNQKSQPKTMTSTFNTTQIFFPMFLGPVYTFK